MLHRLAQWTIAGWRWRRTAAAAWRDGADLLAALADPPAVTLPPWRTAPTPPQVETCPGCGGRRCRPWREGSDCREHDPAQRPAYAAGRALPRDGRHTIAVRLAHWAHIQRLHQLRDQLGWAPAFARVLP